MSTSVLGSVTLTYALVWNHWRRRSGVRLCIDSDNPTGVDAEHLLQAITETTPIDGAPLLLHTCDPALLSGLLDHATPHGPLIEVPAHALRDTATQEQVRHAQARGARLLWHGQPGETPDAGAAARFHNTVRSLTAHDALHALRVALRRPSDASTMAEPQSHSPVVTAAYYEGLASQALVNHALDHQRVHGVIDWPSEEVLYGYRTQQIQPARTVIESLIDAIGADASVETLETRMASEPLLYLRFLRYMNSPALGLRMDVVDLRQGLVTLGYSHLRDWLIEQLPNASSDPNLEPIRRTMVLRGRIMERLVEAGIEDALRREVFLCGLFSQLDLLLNQSMGNALRNLPLPARVTSALLTRTGPYTPWLEITHALESGSSRRVREVCKTHDLNPADVNRALLRALTH